MSPFDLLSDLITKTLPAYLQPVPSIIFCDHDEDGRFQRFAGLARIREELESAHTRISKYPSILMLGLFSVGNSANRKEKELNLMLQWPGIRYLPFGFTKDELIHAAHSAVEGAKTSLPAALLAKPSNVDGIAREVSHWLENRLRNTEGALIDFRNASLGKTTLHPAHLEPVAAISRAHRQMLERLWALEPAVERLVPKGDGLAPVRAAFAEFESCWGELEAVRAEMRSVDDKSMGALLREGECKLERARAALAASIAAIGRLRRDMVDKEH